MKNLPRPEGFEFDENLIKNDIFKMFIAMPFDS